MFNIVSENKYEDGEIIYKEGSSGDWVCVVLSGEVETSRTIGERVHVLGQLHENEIFGETSFFEGTTRTITARAVGKTTIGILDRLSLDHEFNALSSDFRSVVIELARKYRNLVEAVSEYSHRKEDRVLKTLSLRFKDRQSFIKAYSENISSGGLFILTDKPLRKGDAFFLKLQLPEMTDPMEIKCEVAWARKQVEDSANRPSGMGIKFMEMSDKDRSSIREYLKNKDRTDPLSP
ncbi:TIGR02266 family protein [Thermodesulfobacteriota bacterium]